MDAWLFGRAERQSIWWFSIFRQVHKNKNRKFNILWCNVYIYISLVFVHAFCNNSRVELTMALNQFMHPRNRYRDVRPDFKMLADKYKEFREHTTTDSKGKVCIVFWNYHTPLSHLALTATAKLRKLPRPFGLFTLQSLNIQHGRGMRNWCIILKTQTTERKKRCRLFLNPPPSLERLLSLIQHLPPSSLVSGNILR